MLDFLKPGHTYQRKLLPAQFGGALVDLEAQGGTKTYVPLFNSVVAFRY